MLRKLLQLCVWKITVFFFAVLCVVCEGLELRMKLQVFLLLQYLAIHTVGVVSSTEPEPYIGSVVLYDADNCNTTTSHKINNLGAIAVWVVPFWHTDDEIKQTAQRLGTCKVAIQGTNYPNGYLRYRFYDQHI